MKSKGFTLIELLIVVAIIGILAAIAIPNFLLAQTRSKLAKAKAEMRTLGTGLEAYHIDNNHYPWFNDAAYGFPPRYNEISYRLIPLTTPVDYMASVSFKDHFLTGDDSGYGDGVPRWHYNYRNHEYWSSATYPGSVDLKGTHVWVLNCIGPDHAPNQGLLAELTARKITDKTVFYDPTNGTLSSGDVPYTGGQTVYHPNW
jgi:general secretion pathway protein G